LASADSRRPRLRFAASPVTVSLMGVTSSPDNRVNALKARQSDESPSEARVDGSSRGVQAEDRFLSTTEETLRITDLANAAKLSRPAVVVGVPEMGLVGTIAASYLVEHLGLPEIAYVDSEMMPQVIVVQDAEPKPPIRIYGKGLVAVAVSEVPLPARISYDLATQLVAWAKSKQCKMVVGVTGLPSEDRVESGGEKKPVVLAVTNDQDLRRSIKAIGAQPFEHGIIASTYATLLRRCISEGVPNITLLAESYAEFPDPGAAAAALQVLAELLPIAVDVKPLLEGAEEIRLNMRSLMSQTQQAIQQGGQSTRGVYG